MSFYAVSLIIGAWIFAIWSNKDVNLNHVITAIYICSAAIIFAMDSNKPKGG